jgi:hypothetical protein
VEENTLPVGDSGCSLQLLFLHLLLRVSATPIIFGMWVFSLRLPRVTACCGGRCISFLGALLVQLTASAPQAACSLPRPGRMFTYLFYCPHTNCIAVTASYSSSTVSVRTCCRGDMFTYPFHFYYLVRVHCRGNELCCMSQPTVSLPVCVAIKHPYGAYDNTSCAYRLQRYRVCLSVIMFCNLFTYPFLMLIPLFL